MATRSQRKPPAPTATALATMAVMLPLERGVQSVGDYLPGQVYHVPVEEARRLVEVKRFRYVSVAADARATAPLYAAPLASSDPAAATAPGEGGGTLSSATAGAPVNQQDEE